MTSPNDAKDGPRAWSQVLVFGLLLGSCLALALLHRGKIDLVHPIEAWVDADTPEGPIVVATVHADRVIQSGKLEKRWETGPLTSGKTERLPYTGIVLIGSTTTLASVTRVTVRMTTHVAVFDKSQFQKEWTRWDGQLPEDAPQGAEARIFQSPLSPGGSYFALYQHAVNYEGDAALAKYVLLSPVFVVYAISFALLLLLRAIVACRPVAAKTLIPLVIGDRNTPVVAERHGWLWLLAGVAVLIAAGLLVEQQHPYYFTQDDNFAQFLPSILYGCESLSAGEFPNWNPHQYLGAPLAEIGTYALTYPGTYFSYGIAVYLLGDPNATLEVFCCLHLLLGYLALFWLGRLLGLAAPLASAFSLCQVLSGFALVCGRSWYYMTPVYLWAPLLFVALLHLRAQAPSLRWTIGTGLVIGLFFHAGNAQMWVYGLGLAGLFAVWSCLNRSMPWSRIFQSIPAGLVGLGIAAVLLVPQFQATRDLQRKGGEGWDIGEGVLALFAPYPTPIVVAADNQRPYANPEYFGTLYYAGSVFTIAWLAGMLVGGVWRGAGRCLVRDPWNALAVLTLLLALGKLAMLWTWQAYLPVLNQFNHPVKFLPFFHLFSCAAGAMFVNRAIRLASWPRAWQGVTFIVVAGLLLYHAFWSRSAFFVYAEQPYPVMPAEYSVLQRDSARILPLTFMRSASLHHVVGLQHHFPTVYGISAIGGYDPLIEQGAHYGLVLKELQIEPRSTLRKHGVTHLVLHREVTDALKKRDWAWDDWRWLPSSFNGLVADCESAKPVMETETVRVFAVKGAMPIAYTVHDSSHVLPVRLTPSCVDVDVSSLATDCDIALNFLWRPGMRVDADGIPMTVSADGDHHVRALVRAGAKHLKLRYESPWFAGILLGGILVAVGLFGWWAMNAASKLWRRTTADTKGKGGISPRNLRASEVSHRPFALQ